MSGELASSGARVLPGLSVFDLVVDLAVGIVIFVVVIVVAAVLMALLQAVLPGGSGGGAKGGDGDGDAPVSDPGPPAEVGRHPVEDVRELDPPGPGG